MKTNRMVIPFITLMAFGIFVAVGVSIYAVKNPYSTENTVHADNSKFEPEQFYKSACSSCHGSNFDGSSGPSLLGIGKHMTENEIMNVLLNGRNSMPKGLVPGEHIQQMVKFVHGL